MPRPGVTKIDAVPATIYIVDDDISFAKLVAVNIAKPGRYRTEAFDSAAALFDRMSEEPADAIVTDLVMPDVDGIAVTQRIRKVHPHMPIFVLTAHPDLDTAIEALKAGANDYLKKPVNIDELTTQLKRALAERPLLEEAASLERDRQATYSPSGILGDHAKIEEVRQFVHRVGAIPHATVLLLGESGTGKNLVAQAIHYSSQHAKGRFIEVNCSAIPEHLLEAELFGHKRGAFTDARESKRGLIELADGGTLFLDEIGDLSQGLQAKLLNFLESRKFRRVGDTEEREVTLSLTTATNRNIEQLIAAGKFRQDLYYRIRVAEQELPPLREIKSDIPIIAEHFRDLFGREFGKEVSSVSEEALHQLQAWDWPGNVRELRNVLERAMIFADDGVIKPAHLPALQTVSGDASETGTTDAVRIPRRLSLPDVEREYIRDALRDSEGNLQRAAELLGVSRKTLWEKRKKHRLE